MEDHTSDAAGSSPGPTSAPAVSAALRRTVLAMARADQAGAFDTAESRERMLLTGERPVWMAEDSARTAFVYEIGAYTRELRAGGLSLKRVLELVTATVRGIAAPLLDPRQLDALMHDGGRASVEAYFDH